MLVARAATRGSHLSGGCHPRATHPDLWCCRHHRPPRALPEPRLAVHPGLRQYAARMGPGIEEYYFSMFAEYKTSTQLLWVMLGSFKTSSYQLNELDIINFNIRNRLQLDCFTGKEQICCNSR